MTNPWMERPKDYHGTVQIHSEWPGGSRDDTYMVAGSVPADRPGWRKLVLVNLADLPDD